MSRIAASAPWAVTAFAAAGGLALVVGVALTPSPDAAPRARAADLTASTASSITGAPANTQLYATGALKRIDVWAVTPWMPVDDDPFGDLTGFLAQPVAGGAPVFADPEAEPVGHLPRENEYGGTIVPVVTRDTHWVKVLLPGRQGVPPEGDSGQTVGWLRVADVELTATTAYVDVSISGRSIEIVTADGREHVTSGFAWGKPSTPTPMGRTFIMLTRVVPEFAYTRGHPIVYLGVQSPALAGFDGADVAVTAFHYYGQRAGDTSFGCLYLDGPSTDRLAKLPPGTPVIIRP